MDALTPHWLHQRTNLTQVVSYMRRFAREATTDTFVLGRARKICAHLQSGDYNSEILALYQWVHQNIRYIPDPDGVELVQTPKRTIQERAGDCDDMATLLAGMLMCVGKRCRFALVGFHEGSPPSHVFVEVVTPSGWITLDPVANKETVDMLSRVSTKKLEGV